jgi:hypothetical protein
MSHIPSNAMPHAWSHDDEDNQEDSSRGEEGISLKTLAIVGGVAGLLYFVFRR